MEWLWQDLLAHAIYALLVLGGGAVVTWLRYKKPQIAFPLLYGMAAATCMAILIFAFTGRPMFSKRPPNITPDNLEDNLRKWSDDLGLSVSRMPSASTSALAQEIYFGLIVTLQNGNPLAVFRGKDKSGYLQIQCPLTLSPEHLAMLNKLTKDEAAAATQEVVLELGRTRLGFQMTTASGQSIAPGPVLGTPIVLQQTIIIMKGVPITNDLTEATFAQHTNEIDSAVTIVRAATQLILQRYSRQHDAAIATQIKQQ